MENTMATQALIRHRIGIGFRYLLLIPKLQEQISHTINPIKSVFSLIFIFYGLNLTGGSSGEKLFGCL
ncbi:hypothetical protein, partial [Lactiplantibacillus plantarum]|uniref:hypothetical protein n=1 Tax=Lactiplantibacillus plantarum TaxID=1590 RepID=UPI001C9E1D36